MNQEKRYILPDKYVEMLRSGDFTYVSVSCHGDELDKFVVWLPKPLPQVRDRAENFIKKLYGKALEYRLSPRNYVREASSLARIGMHEDAPIEVSRKSVQKHQELLQLYRQQRAEQEKIEKTKLALEEQNPTIIETGTYLGPLEGAILCVWRDQFGYMHVASEWMKNLKVGQKFINGSALARFDELTPITALTRGAATTNIVSQKRSTEDVLDVAGSGPSNPLSMVLFWQGEHGIGFADCVHQTVDPLLEVITIECDDTVRSIGSCSASLLRSKVTRKEVLRDLLSAWGVAESELEDIKRWLDSRIMSVSRPSPARSWPLSRMAMPTRAELADLDERRVTLYVQTMFGFGRRRVEATSLQVIRQRYAQYEDAFIVRYKPRGSRRYLKQFEQGYQPDLVVLLGWDHPDLQERTVQRGSVSSTKYSSCDGRYEAEFDSALLFYLETNPLTRVVLDLRGEEVKTRSRNETEVPQNIPEELSQAVMEPFTSLKVSADLNKSASKKCLFVSYHHVQDADSRSRFEKEFSKSFTNVSVYPGEISTKSSDQIIKRDIRTRIQECNCLVVIIGALTYTRKWVDYEIHSAMNSAQNGSPCPISGFLTPALSSFVEHIRDRIANFVLLNDNNQLSPIAITNQMQEMMLTENGFTLPARLIDNLLTGYAGLYAWPASLRALEKIISESRDSSKALNKRVLLKQDLKP